MIASKHAALMSGPDEDHQKSKRTRASFSNQQLTELEKTFQQRKYLTGQDREALAQSLGLSQVRPTPMIGKLAVEV